MLVFVFAFLHFLVSDVNRCWIMILNTSQHFIIFFLLYKLVTKNLHLATIFLRLVAKRRLKDFFYFEPCRGFHHGPNTSNLV